LIEAFLKLMASPDDFSGPVNTGNPTEFTILELAEKVIQITNSNSVIDFEPLPLDDPTQRQPDILLAKEKLNWEPLIELEEGLIKTVEYFKKII
jgi:UDP-glucuronate decarboxylase